MTKLPFQTVPPRVVSAATGEPVRVDPDVPELCAKCQQGHTPQMCDDCFGRYAANARRKGMPEYMIPQLRARVYRAKTPLTYSALS